MSEVTIRIWDGCKVVQVVSVNQRGGSSTIGAVGGAANGAKPTIEIDPWAGLIFDSTGLNPAPIAFRELQPEPTGEEEDY
jgi:hypothetical protein